MAISPTEIRDWTIYRITNPNGRIYIGVTSNYKNRMRMYHGGWKQSQPLIMRSLNKYGVGNHSFDVIDTFTSDLDFALGKEMSWVRSYMSNLHKYPEQNGMNLTDGGQGTIGYKMSKEQVERLRERSKKLKHTDEAKKKIGEAAKGNQYGKGHKWTDNKMATMKERMKGNKFGKGPSENNMVSIKSSAHKKRIPILQYDQKNNFIKEHLGVLEAQRELGVSNISGVLTGKLKHTAGFIFKYK